MLRLFAILSAVIGLQYIPYSGASATNNLIENPGAL